MLLACGKSVMPGLISNGWHDSLAGHRKALCPAMPEATSLNRAEELLAPCGSPGSHRVRVALCGGQAVVVFRGVTANGAADLAHGWRRTA